MDWRLVEPVDFHGLDPKKGPLHQILPKMASYMIDGTGMTEDVGSGQMTMSREWVFI
jgi:hypothetical protein